jgi:hypothetical protein
MHLQQRWIQMSCHLHRPGIAGMPTSLTQPQVSRYLYSVHPLSQHRLLRSASMVCQAAAAPLEHLLTAACHLQVAVFPSAHQ